MNTDEILNQASEQQSQQPKDTYVTKNGVILKFKRVNRHLAVEIANRVKLPKPPKVYLKDKHRYEENPNDPEYQEKLNEILTERGILIANLYVTLGTKVEYIPDDLQRPEEDDWYNDLIELGLDISPTGNARYRAWLAFYVCQDDEEEYTKIAIESMKFSGNIAEEDVKLAEERFRSNNEGSTNTKLISS